MGYRIYTLQGKVDFEKREYGLTIRRSIVGYRAQTNEGTIGRVRPTVDEAVDSLLQVMRDQMIAEMHADMEYERSVGK